MKMTDEAGSKVSYDFDISHRKLLAAPKSIQEENLEENGKSLK